MAKYEIEFEYFHGFESEQFAFYRIPKVLFTDDYFKDLSSDAKILYGLMLDRMSLSIKSQWIDKQDRVYIIFTLEQVTKYMNCGKDKGVKILAELDTDKGIGLIERVKQGQGKPTLIYVKSFIIKERPGISQTSEPMESRSAESRNLEYGDAEVLTSEKPKSRVLENRSLESGKAEVLTSEKPKCRVLKNRSAEFGKADTINTYNNYTEVSDIDYSDTNLINPSYLSRGKPEGQADRMDEIRTYTNIIKTNVEYDWLMQNCGIGEQGYIDEIVELMVETISIPKDHVLIAGAEYPYQLVKAKLLKVDSSHIEYVIESLHNNTTKVRNIKSYLLTTIYNAPSTIDSYYRAEVNHDMYGIN